MVLEISYFPSEKTEKIGVGSSIKFVHSIMEDGLLVSHQDSICNFEENLNVNDMHFFNDHLIVHEHYTGYWLINPINGVVCDRIRSFGEFLQLRPIDGGAKLSMYAWSPAYNESTDSYIGSEPTLYPEFYRTVDVQGGKFVCREVEDCVEKVHNHIFGAQNARIRWNFSNAVTDTLVSVNFGMMCNFGKCGMKHGQPGCDIMKSMHRDTYGLVYVPTCTFIRLRKQPTASNIRYLIDNAPTVTETMLSQDGSMLAVVVRQMLDVDAPMKRNQLIVVINTVTGNHEIAYDCTAGSACDTPQLLYFEDDKAIVFTAQQACIRQPIFRARIDTAACKLYNLLDGRLPMEIMLQIASYV
jgi:hypothetical protein